jgi:type IV secretion system protein VirD4
MGTCNYVFTDPSGEILSKIGHFLQDIKDYKIKVFNIDDFSKSMRYNPLLYAKTEKDINILVDALNRNIKPAKKGTSNEFFDDAKDSLMCALIALLKELYPTEGDMDEKTRKKNMKRQTLKNVMRLLLLAEQECLEEGGDGISATSTLDAIFDRLLEHNPRSYAAASWKSFKVGGPKVCNEVIISACAVYSRYFNTDAMEDLTCEDELDLYELAKDEPCALFIVTPSSDTSYNFMASMIYTQLFSIVTSEGKRHAEENNLSDPALPRHLSFWLDEFSNTGKIPQFLELLSVVRKYNISINVIVQGLSQLRGMYKDSWETIIANMDTMIYLGGQEPDTIKMMSEKLGKETIKGHNYTLSKRNGDSAGYKNMARSLLTPDEIARMVRSHELVFITGCKPIQTRKYDLKKHPNYRYCGEYSRKNNFDLYYLIGDRSINLTALDEAAITEEEIRSYKFE